MIDDAVLRAMISGALRQNHLWLFQDHNVSRVSRRRQGAVMCQL